MKQLILAAGVMMSMMAHAGPTVLYQDAVIEVEQSLADPNDLWVVAKELPRVNGFELKPEGACLDDICVPVKQDEDNELFVTRKATGWFNVTGLARKLQQPYAVDHDEGVWSLGAVPATRNRFVSEHMAPDFQLVDKDGKPVSLSEFKDMKVLLLTWASW